MKSGAQYWIAGRMGCMALGALHATTRFEIRGEEHYRATAGGGRPAIFLLWHGRLLPLAYLHRGQGVATLISRSADGEYIARIVKAWGYLPVRGSSSRGGGAALKTLLRHARTGRSLAFTPDGPRGPRQKIKLGALVAAQLTGLPLLPMAAGADRAWWLGSWDRFLVPKPFSCIRVAYGVPHEIPRDAGPTELERHARRLEAELDRLLREVDQGGRDR